MLSVVFCFAESIERLPKVVSPWILWKTVSENNRFGKGSSTSRYMKYSELSASFVRHSLSIVCFKSSKHARDERFAHFR